MAWIRGTFASRARTKIEVVLVQMEEEEKKIQGAISCMSIIEWRDWLDDIEELLRENSKRNMSMVADQWDEIQRQRIEKIRGMLGIPTDDRTS